MIDFNTSMNVRVSGENGTVHLIIEEESERVVDYVFMATVAREIAEALNKSADDAFNSIL